MSIFFVALMMLEIRLTLYFKKILFASKEAIATKRKIGRQLNIEFVKW